MAYSIEFIASAARQLRNLPSAVQDQLSPVISALAENPRPSGVVKLSGSDDLYRVRSGNYRIIYQIQDEAMIILIVKIGHRRDIYR